MPVAPSWGSIARLEQQVLYRQFFTGPHSILTLLRPFKSAGNHRQTRGAASASAAVASLDNTDDDDGTTPIATLVHSSKSPGIPSTRDVPSSKGLLKLYSHRLRVIKDNADRESLLRLWEEVKSQNIQMTPSSIYGRHLWHEFLQVGLENREMREELWRYALEQKEQSGSFYLGFYETVVSTFLLRGRGRLAYEWHKIVKSAYPTPERSFLSLLGQLKINIGLLSKTSNDFLQQIYKDGDERDLYDSIVPSLCAAKNHKRAFNWHKFLLRNSDFPSPEVTKDPQVGAMLKDYMAALSTDWTSAGGVNATQAILQNGSQSRNTISGFEQEDSSNDRHQLDMTREAMNRHLGEVHGVTEKHISDEFCARLFATRMLSVSVVISGLALIGVDVLGPIALRELAVRSSGRKAFLSGLDALKEGKISIKPCVYSHLVLRAAYEESDDLFQSIITTDQHPDVFEDIELQEKLLHSYIARKDWLQAHRTLIIIALLRPIQPLQLSPVGSAWNFLVSSNTARARHPSITHLVNQLRVNRIAMDRTTLISISQRYLKAYLPRRPDLYNHPNRRHEIADPADLSIILNLFLRAQVDVRPLSPHKWTKVIARLGMLGRYQELARLSIWLALTYSRDARQRTNTHEHGGVIAETGPDTPGATDQVLSSHPLSRRDEIEPTPPARAATERQIALQIIFSTDTQFSIVAWGILGLLPRAERSVREKSADWFSSTKQPDCELWACGVKLLKVLQDHGAPIRTSVVRSIVQDRLWMLFGTMNFTRWENRLASENNPHSLAHMINHVNNIVWPGLFEDIAPFLLLDETNEWSEDLFHTVFRRQLLKRQTFWESKGKHRMRKWGSPFKTHRARLTTRPKRRRLSSVKGVKFARIRTYVADHGGNHFHSEREIC
ncbi:MAG: hypothetical protein Q9165_007216 [Trypethelium subeluteriae]